MGRFVEAAFADEVALQAQRLRATMLCDSAH
jgi:hypothetical protein